jgi:hypothetical protein
MKREEAVALSSSSPSPILGLRRLEGEAALAWTALAVVLLALLPLFLRMPLNVDTIVYDLRARTVLRKGMLYQSHYMHSPPGMVWAQAVLRGAVGWSSEALRACDLLILASIIGLLVWGVQPRPLSAGARAWSVLLLALFYLSRTEWSHCQRDPWMLLPALLALYLQQRQARDFIQHQDMGSDFAVRAVLEGVCWGLATLMKPFVLLSAAACFVIEITSVWHHTDRNRRRLLGYTALVLAGGLVVGGFATTWLYLSRDWPYFIHDNFGDYNVKYFHLEYSLTSRLKQSVTGWDNYINVAALPVAGFLLVRFFWKSSSVDRVATAKEALLAMFYLTWFFQANFIQRQWAYQVLPAQLLALAVLSGFFWSSRPVLTRWVLLPPALAWLLWINPLLQSDKLGLWGRCWTAKESAKLKDALTTNSRREKISWEDLHQVACFLRERHLSDGELTCYNCSTNPLYLELDLEPSTRFDMLENVVGPIWGHDQEVWQALKRSPQKYVVSDLANIGVPPSHYHKHVYPERLPTLYPQLFPYNQPVVLRVGRYLVHEVRLPDKIRPDFASMSRRRDQLRLRRVERGRAPCP